MSLENILNKILAEGKAEADKIGAQAQADVQSIITQAKATADERRAQILNQAQREANEYELPQVTVAQLEARKDRLMAKQDVVNEAFTQALAELRKMPSAEYRAYLKSMLLEAVETGTESIIVDQHDRSFFTDGFITELNIEVANMGKKGQLTLSPEARETGGGFVLVAGDVDVNVTFPSRLKALREELEAEVARILFQ